MHSKFVNPTQFMQKLPLEINKNVSQKNILHTNELSADYSNNLQMHKTIFIVKQ
jgi:hypothetical protein